VIVERMEISRRSFVKGLGLVAGGLALGVFPERELFAKTPEEFHPNAFVHLAADGTVSIVCHKSEMGQGVRSSLPMVVADEMGADLARVRVLQGDLDAALGEQSTDGSSSLRASFDPLRLCGATARVILISVAASRWQVPEKECDTQEGFVVHVPSSRRLEFGSLAADAALLPIPDPHSVPLRDRSQWRYMGKEGLPLTDGAAIVTGAAVYAADVELPGLLVAVVARPPVLGGHVARCDSTAARAVAGVRQVLTLPSPIPPYGYQPLGGVAVVADHTWAALEGRAKLELTWDNGPNASYDSDTDRLELLKTVDRACDPVRDHGDVAIALAKAARTVRASYFVPHLAHTPMEPPCAAAFYRDGQCEIWSCTQSPGDTATQVAVTLGIELSRVKVHVTLLGGAFGRKSKPDYAAEAAWLSRAVGAPVRLQWSREDDIQHDYFHAISAQHLEAGLDESGKVTAFLHRTAFPSIESTFAPGIIVASVGELALGVLDLPFDVPNFRAEVGPALPHVRIGWLRSVCNNHHAFAVGSFLDEVAFARGLDPRESLLDILGPSRKLTSPADFGTAVLPNYGDTLARHPIDVGRYRSVVERVTSMANWPGRHRQGRALGLAVHRSFLSYVAVVIEVSRNPDHSIRVDEAWLAADCGVVVNPDRVRSQLEGAVCFGLSVALYGGATLKQGAVTQSNFADYRLIRMSEAPRAIHVDLCESDALPGGAGEPGVPPVAPALANAIFALTGERRRELPIR
jgi:isoquinoline 1-oxidoreductase beta subunit